MCFNDMLAIGALKACRQAGVRVPDEISVTGFDNIAFSEFSVPPLTTLDQPKYEIGREAAQLLLSLLSEESDLRSHTQGVKVLKGKLLVRATTAKPRKKET
jgi:LacI family repressor for deo operon, udp, cdd, tsx, nupC, and nupG